MAWYLQCCNAQEGDRDGRYECLWCAGLTRVQHLAHLSQEDAWQPAFFLGQQPSTFTHQPSVHSHRSGRSDTRCISVLQRKCLGNLPDHPRQCITHASASPELQVDKFQTLELIGLWQKLMTYLMADLVSSLPHSGSSGLDSLPSSVKACSHAM